MKNVVVAVSVCFFVVGAFAARPSARNFQSFADRKAERARVEREKAEAARAAAEARMEPGRDEPPPAKSSEKYRFMGPERGWGVLMERAPYYSLQGKNLGRLPSGGVFAYNGIRHGSGEYPLLVVTFREPPAPGAPNGPYLLDCGRVAAYSGAPGDVDPAIVARISAYYAAHGEAEFRRAELGAKRMEELKEGDPLYRAARESRRRYNESIDEAARLEEEMNRSQGKRRDALLDELRDLKYRQQGLKSKMDSETRAYRERCAANVGRVLSEEELQQDAAYREYDRKRRELEPSLKGMLPPKRK